MDKKLAWKLNSRDIKKYPHFDSFSSPKKITEYVSDSRSVITHKFYPFIQYKDEWMPFGERHASRAKKTRLIRYACRWDSAVFKYYRHLLSELYEKKLIKLNLSDSVLAYRKIPVDKNSEQGKCNIDFAHDVFKQINSINQCCVVTLDISSFFECIDHQHLKECWAELLGETRLPDDQFAVFKAITNYSYVDRDSLYQRLGYLDIKTNSAGQKKYNFKTKKSEMPIQLCTADEFRSLVAGRDKIIRRNKNGYGIPQGSPISDLLANIYLTNFDLEMKLYAKELGGYYFRYSDDLLFILPDEKGIGASTHELAEKRINDYGKELKIKESKTSVGRFYKNRSGILSYEYISGQQGKNGLEYLGFRFDGKYVYLRDSTLSRLHRKIRFSARKRARQLVKANQGKSYNYLMEKFNTSNFLEKFYRVSNFYNSSTTYQSWTFWTYVKRSINKFDGQNIKFQQQIKNLKQYIYKVSEHEINRAISEYGSDPA